MLTTNRKGKDIVCLIDCWLFSVQWQLFNACTILPQQCYCKCGLYNQLKTANTGRCLCSSFYERA